MHELFGLWPYSGPRSSWPRFSKYTPLSSALHLPWVLLVRPQVKSISGIVMILSLLFRLLLLGLNERSMLCRLLSRLNCITNIAHAACFTCYGCGIVYMDTRQAIGVFEGSQSEEIRCRGIYVRRGGCTSRYVVWRPDTSSQCIAIPIWF